MTAQTITFNRYNALPSGNLTPYSCNFVKDGGNHITVQLASADGTVTFRTHSTADIQDLINTSISSLAPDWSTIANKPTSTAAAIDAAVSNAHTHSNKATVLDLLSVDGNGKLLFNSNSVICYDVAEF